MLKALKDMAARYVGWRETRKILRDAEARTALHRARTDEERWTLDEVRERMEQDSGESGHGRRGK